MAEEHKTENELEGVLFSDATSFPYTSEIYCPAVSECKIVYQGTEDNNEKYHERQSLCRVSNSETGMLSTRLRCSC